MVPRGTDEPAKFSVREVMMITNGKYFDGCDEHHQEGAETEGTEAITR